MAYHKVGQKAYHTSPIFMEVQIKMRYHLTPVGISTKSHWMTLIPCCREHQLVEPFWIMIHISIKHIHPLDPVISLTGIDSRERV